MTNSDTSILRIRTTPTDTDQWNGVALMKTRGRDNALLFTILSLQYIYVYMYIYMYIFIGYKLASKTLCTNCVLIGRRCTVGPQVIASISAVFNIFHDWNTSNIRSKSEWIMVIVLLTENVHDIYN